LKGKACPPGKGDKKDAKGKKGEKPLPPWLKKK
jgi:hypothetical protein